MIKCINNPGRGIICSARGLGTGSRPPVTRPAHEPRVIRSTSNIFFFTAREMWE